MGVQTAGGNVIPTPLPYVEGEERVSKLSQSYVWMVPYFIYIRFKVLSVTWY